MLTLWHNTRVMNKTLDSSGDLAMFLRRRMRDAELIQQDIAIKLQMSRSWVAQELFGDTQKAIRNLAVWSPEKLEPLAKLLNWDSAREMLLELNIMPELLGKLKREDSASLVGFHLVPIIGVAEAGFPETYPVPNRLKRPGTRVFQVHGESMNGGNKPILDGDHLLVDINQTDLQEGKVFVIEIIGNGHCVKRARNRKGEWWLESDNTEFASYAPEEAVIFGRVYYKMSGDDL